jgi:glycosyltransferase involved in cell wall biosynthesis
MPPFPLDNGGRIRAHRLLTGLASEFATTLVTCEHDPASGRPAYNRAALASLLPQIDVVTVRGIGAVAPPSIAAGLRELVSPLPASWRPYHRSPLSDAIAEEARRRRAAIVHFDYFAFCPSIPGVLNIRAPHNVESSIARQEAKAQWGYGRLWHEAEWRKLRALERRALRSSQLCVAVSDPDARALAAAGAARVAVCPNGTDPVAACDPPTRHSGETLRVVFVGSGTYPPYERGLAWFVREVLPRVRARVPAALDVVGSPPTARVSAPGVRYVGRVAAVRPWYERAHVAIVPVFEGSGTRLKVIEAMAHGRPVVSTRLGAEGLPIGAPAHYLEANDAAAFAARLHAVAEWCRTADSALLRMLEAARRAIAPLFWPEITRRLTALYRQELERRQAP